MHNKTLFILGTSLQGHHFEYICNLAKKSSKKYQKVIVCLHEIVIENQTIALLKNELFNMKNIEYVYLSNPKKSTIFESNSLIWEIRNWQRYKCLLDNYPEILSSDVIYIFFDSIRTVCSLIGLPVKGSRNGLVIIQSRKNNKFIKSIFSMGLDLFFSLYLRYLSTIKIEIRFWTIDSLAINIINSQQLKLLQDPIIYPKLLDTNNARKILGLELDKLVISIVGKIDSRKGIKNLLLAISKHSVRENIIVLTCGVTDSSYLEELHVISKDHNINLHVINKHYTQEESDLVISASDFAWLGYINHHSVSGFLTLCKVIELPSISADYGQIFKIAQEKKINYSINPDDHNQILNAIKKAVTMKKNGQLSQKYIANEEHTWDKFMSKIL